MKTSNQKIKSYLVIVNSPKGSIENDNEEFISLTLSAGTVISGITYVNIKKFNRNTLIGKGKLQSIKEDLEAVDIDLIIFNKDLIASQERNLEKILKYPVIDRSRLILDIFARRAQTNSGKLQVELAQLKHLSTRLIRGWTHLERQKGGIGLRGPGEKQLETDRRLLQERIRSIELKLKKLHTQRKTNRKSRNKVMKNVALVGYTNAGKSTLFNSLSNSKTFVADKMFTTLDPIFRPISISKNRRVVISDTVGFIRELPSELIEAFLSTLEEISDADLLIHVLDSSDRFMHQNKQSVESILKQIGADQIPTIYAYNKIDLVKKGLDLLNTYQHIEVSAKEDIGTETLIESIALMINPQPIKTILRINVNESKIRAQIYSIANVIQECLINENTLELTVEIDERNLLRLKKNKKIKAIESKLSTSSKRI
ncbi:MAG TPA: GTPase HflX [Gammaproteobacteria bacterium]|nr:GTPase HflX [Gammaproteobacteria bacterium]HIK76584.1 GTPase HflX [Gammaproteobacteria bacterium]